MRYDLVLNLFTAKGLNKEVFEVHGGEQWRPMLNIRDASRGILFALENDLPGLYNLIHSNYTVKLIAEIVAAHLHAEFTTDPEKRDIRSTFAKNNKLRTRGFHTKHSLLDAVKEIEKDPLETWKNYKNPIYHNLDWLKGLKEAGKI